jgi:TonB family protein
METIKPPKTGAPRGRAGDPDAQWRFMFPGMSEYGAAELKRNSRRFLIRGLAGAGLIHLLIIGLFWIYAWLFPEVVKPKTRVVRIMKYEELGPPPSVAENTSEDEFQSGKGDVEARRRGGGGSAEGRQRLRAAISQQVSGKGMLGMMNGVGAVTIGEGTGLLGAESTGGGGLGADLDALLSSVEEGGGGAGTAGGAEASEGTASVRGGRADQVVTIDDMVAKLGGVRRESVSRKGQLKIENASEVSGQARRSSRRSPDAIHEVMLRHVNAVRYCYERALRQNPALKGKVTVRVTVAPEGGVSDAEIVSSTMGDADVEGCILSRIRMWNDFDPIDPSEGDVTFRQVYAFGT